jgi:hypothetical protein
MNFQYDNAKGMRVLLEFIITNNNYKAFLVSLSFSEESLFHRYIQHYVYCIVIQKCIVIIGQLGFINLSFNCLSELVQEVDDVALCLATPCCMIL